MKLAKLLVYITLAAIGDGIVMNLKDIKRHIPIRNIQRQVNMAAVAKGQPPADQARWSRTRVPLRSGPVAVAEVCRGVFKIPWERRHKTRAPLGRGTVSWVAA
jgi:hypothetical protein